MLKITNNFSVLDLNDQRLRGSVDRIMGRIIRDAARVWLDTALGIVPVWSGASHSTFQALAASAGQTISVTPKASTNAPDYRAIGAARGSGEIVTKGPVYAINYETTLRGFVSNELGNPVNVKWGLIHPVPYNFRATSDAVAFNFIVQRINKEFPQILSQNIQVRLVRG